MIEDKLVVFMQPNQQASLESGRNVLQNHCSQKSIERYSSTKKRSNNPTVVQQPHIGKVLQYNEYHDESSQSNQSPEVIIVRKMKLETFQNY